MNARTTAGRRRGMLLALAAGLLLALAPAARADTFCVERSGCPDPGHNFTTIQAAIAAAKANNPPGPTDPPTRDTILVGPGVFNGAVDTGFNNAVDIYGSGRWFPFPTRHPGTLIRREDGNSLNTAQISGNYGGVTASTLHDVSVRVSTGSSNVGVRTDGDLTNVHVFSDGAVPSSSSGVNINGNGNTLYRGGTISLLGGGVGLSARLGVAEGLHISADEAVNADGYTVRNSTIAARIGGRGFDLRLENDVMHIHGPNSVAFTAQGAGFNNNQRINAFNVTALGDGNPSSVAADATGDATGSGNSARITIRNSIVRGFGRNFHRKGDTQGSNTAPADIDVAYSDYDTSVPSLDEGGVGALNTTSPGGNTSADPGFVSLNNYRLRPTSPLIDLGNPVFPDPNLFDPPEATTDFDGNPRRVDGDGKGGPRVDIGAFEFQQKRPTITSAKASPKNPATGQKVSFSGAGFDADGEPVKFTWSFGDGKSAKGAHVSHSYKKAGKKTAVLTVTDSRGLTNSRKVTVQVHA